MTIETVYLVHTVLCCLPSLYSLQSEVQQALKNNKEQVERYIEFCSFYKWKSDMLC